MDINIVKQLEELKNGIPLSPLPNLPEIDSSIAHPPARNPQLTDQEEKLAIKNALRYFPCSFHKELGKEFLNELRTHGHIYMYRFRPTSYEMRAYPIEYYPTKVKACAAIQAMIMNNLDKAVAQFPHELVTYGGNGCAFQNWAQYRLTMQYLNQMNENQTLILNSGHPQGLFPSSPKAPRMVISNGNVIPNYSSKDLYEKMYAMGNTMYGQMTAGSFCYIGPQGIVHGTTLTILNCNRYYRNTDEMKGVVYLSSGLGGMSGAQPKAGEICGCIAVIAEINEKALDKRLKQGWVKEKISEIPKVIARIKELKEKKEASSIGYLGNVVDLWEALAQEKDNLIELGSDQTSLHNPYFGGYYPVQLTFEESNQMMREDLEKFKGLVHESLKRQLTAIHKLSSRGMKFWDYGNSFLLQCQKAGADVYKDEKQIEFKYPTYFQTVMDKIFGLGFGPFRWVCTSQSEEDLFKSDKIAENVLMELKQTSPEIIQGQYIDNLKWIREAAQHKLVVGSQARILYADTQARTKIATAFNQAIAKGDIKAPIVLSRDHHDVSGTDSPFRETSAITDGSKYTADMAIQNVIGDACRGATWVALHNGGGVGWGEVVNGGFGMVLDGTELAQERIDQMLKWDVNNGVARRAWSGNEYALFNLKRQAELDKELIPTIPNYATEEIINEIFQ